MKAKNDRKRKWNEKDRPYRSEIAWYALAHLITEEPIPEEMGKESDKPEGMLTCCRHCGRFFIRRSSRTIMPLANWWLTCG